MPMNISYQRIAHSFTKAAQSYDSAAHVQSLMGTMLLNHLKKYCQPPIFNKALEIGCGPGSFTNKLLDHVSLQQELIINDLSPRLLEQTYCRSQADAAAQQIKLTCWAHNILAPAVVAPPRGLLDATSPAQPGVINKGAGQDLSSHDLTKHDLTKHESKVNPLIAVPSAKRQDKLQARQRAVLSVEQHAVQHALLTDTLHQGWGETRVDKSGALEAKPVKGKNFSHGGTLDPSLASGLTSDLASGLANTSTFPIYGDDFFAQDCDLIVSNATFQWFPYLDQALSHFRTMATPQSTLLFSSFAAGTCQELASLLGWGLKYYSKEELIDILSCHCTDFEIIHLNYKQSFDSAFHLLRQIRAMGVNALDKEPLSQREIKALMAAYEQNFSDDRGQVYLTWCPFLFYGRWRT